MSVNLDLLVGLTEGMFSYPMEKFSEFFYNGHEVEETVNLTDCTKFANYHTAFQTVEIYRDNKIVYSCSVTKIYDIPIITHVFAHDGKIYEVNYNRLYEEMSNNAEIVKAFRVNTLCEEIEKALTAAENDIDDVNEYGILLAYTNYSYNMGRYHAYLDSLDMLAPEEWGEIVSKHKDRNDSMEKRADVKYRSLKKTIFGNENA